MWVSVLFLPVASATATVFPGPGHPLVNPESGKCLDVHNPNGLAPSQLEDETPVHIFRCTGGEGQRWRLQDGQLKNTASGKCLDIYNPHELSPDQYEDETKVQLLSCKGNANQRWALVDEGQGHRHLVNIPSGKCLDIYSPSGNLNDDTAVQLFTCDGEKTNQLWSFNDNAEATRLNTTANASALGYGHHDWWHGHRHRNHVSWRRRHSWRHRRHSWRHHRHSRGHSWRRRHGWRRHGHHGNHRDRRHHHEHYHHHGWHSYATAAEVMV